MQAWRRSADAHYVWIRRKNDPLSEEYVRSVLRQCRIADDEINRFVGANSKHP